MDLVKGHAFLFPCGMPAQGAVEGHGLGLVVRGVEERLGVPQLCGAPFHGVHQCPADAPLSHGRMYAYP